MSSLGVFGGQFDPPHVGHLAIVRAARDQLDLDVLVMPDGTPPHRGASARPAAVRVALAEAAFAGEPRVRVVAPEHPDRALPTVELLERLGGERPLVLILGADQWAALDSWYRPQRVRELATLAVAPRPGIAVEDSDVVLLRMPPVDVSSTEVREAIAAGADPRRWLPEAVAAEVERAGLYGGRPGS